MQTTHSSNLKLEPDPFSLANTAFLLCKSFLIIIFKNFLFFNYSWHNSNTVLLQVYNTVIRPLYSLQSGHPSESGAHLTPYIVNIIAYTLCCLCIPEPALHFSQGFPAVTVVSDIQHLLNGMTCSKSGSYCTTSSLTAAALIPSLTELCLEPDWLGSDSGSATCQLWATWSLCASVPHFV